MEGKVDTLAEVDYPQSELRIACRNSCRLLTALMILIPLEVLTDF